MVKEEAVSLIRNIRKEKGLEEIIDQDVISGTTANVIVIYKKIIYCANAGDSRSVLSVNRTAIPLSYDHKPENPVEKARILNAGGMITMGRIDGGLNLSRALGDLEYKKRTDLPPEKQKVTALPDIEEYEIKGGEEFILIGCDGVWQKYVDSNQRMVQILHTLRSSSTESREVLSKLLDDCLSPKVCEIGCDNMSAILIEFTT